MSKYYKCPQCCKKGVYIQTGRYADDCYSCRYCQWSVYLSPDTDEEKREVADFELSVRMARYQNLNEAYEAGYKAGTERLYVLHREQKCGASLMKALRERSMLDPDAPDAIVVATDQKEDKWLHNHPKK